MPAGRSTCLCARGEEQPPLDGAIFSERRGAPRLFAGASQLFFPVVSPMATEQIALCDPRPRSGRSRALLPGECEDFPGDDVVLPERGGVGPRSGERAGGARAGVRSECEQSGLRKPLAGEEAAIGCSGEETSGGHFSAGLVVEQRLLGESAGSQQRAQQRIRRVGQAGVGKRASISVRASVVPGKLGELAWKTPRRSFAVMRTSAPRNVTIPASCKASNSSSRLGGGRWRSS